MSREHYNPSDVDPEVKAMNERKVLSGNHAVFMGFVTILIIGANFSERQPVNAEVDGHTNSTPILEPTPTPTSESSDLIIDNSDGSSVEMETAEPNSNLNLEISGYGADSPNEIIIELNDVISTDPNDVEIPPNILAVQPDVQFPEPIKNEEFLEAKRIEYFVKWLHELQASPISQALKDTISNSRAAELLRMFIANASNNYSR